MISQRRDVVVLLLYLNSQGGDFLPQGSILLLKVSQFRLQYVHLLQFAADELQPGVDCGQLRLHIDVEDRWCCGRCSNVGEGARGLSLASLRRHVNKAAAAVCSRRMPARQLN